MRILITADWQAELQNLDVCQSAWSEVLDICEKDDIRTVVVAGDLKRAYDPINVDCVNWWQRAIHRATKIGVSVVALLGNHDRTSQYNDDRNWFPILRKAGAKCVDKEPEVIRVEGGEVALLPFTTKKGLLRERAEWLSKQVTNGDGVLIFHQDIRDCSYNVLGRKSEAAITVDDLCPESYQYCFGGHIHKRQKLGKNVYYVGSPFASEWGEANQQKGYVVLKDGEFEFVKSKLPGWFDPTWPGFYEPESWKGCHVRVHAKCRNANEYARLSTKIRYEAEKRYDGAEIFIAADFEGKDNRDATVKISSTDPDEVKIREYVKETCPVVLNRKEVSRYLVEKLDTINAKWRRLGTGVTFVSAKAKNFLSFKELDLDWTQKGITVVQGRNKDRDGRSNGAGKSSMMGVVPVALFGTTFKGQKHDRWSRRHCDDKAIVRLEIRDGKNRTIVIERGRKPTRLQLWVDGKDQTIGMKPQQKDATQGEIEKLTGFTWQTMANSIYIDQEIARAFLQGTKGERTKVLSRFQNLERFENALKLVRDDKTESDKRIGKIQTNLKVLEERVSGLNKRKDILLEESEQRAQEMWKEVQKRKRQWLENKQILHRRMEVVSSKADKLESKAKALREESNEVDKHLRELEAKGHVIWMDLNKLKAAMKHSLCPTCRQDVDKNRLAEIEEKQRLRLHDIKLEIRPARDEVTRLNLDYHRVEGVYDRWNMERNRLESSLGVCKRHYEDIYGQYQEMKRREHDESGAYRKTKQELKETLEKVGSLKIRLEELNREKDFYQYCEKAMSRDGIPAFLNALLCPTLNGAAEYYSDLFGDKAIQVRFEIENGDFVPKVLNATGGEDIDDQSEGEKALAGLVASFALREAAPKCNLLVLDEPGAGLDPDTARQFARGLSGLKQKFDSIFVITHNVHIAQELEGENKLLVVKERGVSRLVA